MSDNTTLDLTDLTTNDEEPEVDVEISEEPEESTVEESTVEESTVESTVEEETTPEESTVEESTVEESNVEEESTPEESNVEEESTPSVQEVASNIKEILTTDPVEEPVSELSFTDKFNELTRIVQALGFRDPWNSRLSALKDSTDSDTDKLKELIDVLKDWRFKPEFRNNLVTIKNDSESSIENRFLQVVDIVERIGLREPFRSQLIALK